MSFRNISAWAIRNPIPPIVLFIALTIAGFVSFARMDVNNNPDIDFPIVWISISQPGAAPSELETQITQKVESAVRSLQGIDEINSNVTEGQSTTVVQLAIGTPIDRAVEDVRSAVQQIRGNLPDGILEPQIGRVDSASDNDIASFTAVAPDMTVEELSWYIDNTVSKELLSISGMSAVNRNGGVNREIRVKLDPARLQSYGLTASQVNQQLLGQMHASFRYCHSERSAFIQAAFYIYTTLVQLHQFLNERETNTCSLLASTGNVLYAVEAFKHALELILRNANSGVGY